MKSHNTTGTADLTYVTSCGVDITRCVAAHHAAKINSHNTSGHTKVCCIYETSCIAVDNVTNIISNNTAGFSTTTCGSNDTINLAFNHFTYVTSHHTTCIVSTCYINIFCVRCFTIPPRPRKPNMPVLI